MTLIGPPNRTLSTRWIPTILVRSMSSARTSAMRQGHRASTRAAVTVKWNPQALRARVHLSCADRRWIPRQATTTHGALTQWMQLAARQWGMTTPVPPSCSDALEYRRCVNRFRCYLVLCSALSCCLLLRFILTELLCPDHCHSLTKHVAAYSTIEGVTIGHAHSKKRRRARTGDHSLRAPTATGRRLAASMRGMQRSAWMTKHDRAFSRISALSSPCAQKNSMLSWRRVFTPTTLASAAVLIVSTLLSLLAYVSKAARMATYGKCSPFCSQPRVITQLHSSAMRVTTRRRASRVLLCSLAALGATVHHRQTALSPTLPPAQACCLPEVFVETMSIVLPLD